MDLAQEKVRFYSLLKFSNTILAVTAVFCGLYILFLGLLPEINLLIVKLNDSTNGYVYKGTAAASESNLDHKSLRNPPKENRLVIPKIYVNAHIWEGESEETLSRGVWRRPLTNTPDQGGNTVLTAHRFLYNHGPNTFFHLDKLQLEDTFIVFWDGIEYIYKVEEIREVAPTDIHIENSTLDSRVTLYTCAPLYSSEKRLVITGMLEQKHAISI